jgi:tRNA-specific 2-thiouridylase
MSRLVVGLSGGVDSAVAALLLKQQGHDVSAVFMKNWDEDDEAGYCPAEQDLADARFVADRLDIELHTTSFSAEYWDRVFRHFLDEYQAGRTPSPDIICNREIKFRAFLDHALKLGADFIATGHYARIEKDPRIRLLAGIDTDKDQTYFLHTLSQQQLGKSLFPLGDMLKPDVRKLARDAGFPVHDKKDSTGICFIGERRFSEFLARYLQKNPGEIRTAEDEVIGTHDGLMFYTIGQRQGLGIGGRKTSTGEPWYVAGKETGPNILRVVQGVNHPALFRQALRASQLHWISAEAPPASMNCRARIRHQQPLQACTVHIDQQGACIVRFEQPQRAIAPGQSVVFYDDDECLGGGIIEEGLTSEYPAT